MPDDFAAPYDPTKKKPTDPNQIGATMANDAQQPNGGNIAFGDPNQPPPIMKSFGGNIPFDGPSQPPAIGKVNIGGGNIPFDAPPTPAIGTPKIGSATMPSAAAPPTPSAPKPGADWVPTADGQGWLPPNMAGSAAAWHAPATAAPSAAPAAPTAPVGAPGPPAAPLANNQPPSIATSFQQALIDKLNPQAVNSSNPAIQPAIQANQLAEQRGTEAQRNLLAEQAARDGTNNSGGFDSKLLGIQQDSAQRQGQFAGNAVQHLQDQQDGDIMAALGIGNSATQANAAREQQGSQFGQTLAEQKRQADQDAELKRLGINTQSTLGQGDLSLRGRLGDQQSNLGLLQALLQHNQFGRQLDQQGTQFGEGLDQSGLLGLLGLLR